MKKIDRRSVLSTVGAGVGTFGLMTLQATKTEAKPAPVLDGLPKPAAEANKRAHQFAKSHGKIKQSEVIDPPPAKSAEVKTAKVVYEYEDGWRLSVEYEMSGGDLKMECSGDEYQETFNIGGRELNKVRQQIRQMRSRKQLESKMDDVFFEKSKQMKSAGEVPRSSSTSSKGGKKDGR